MATISISTLARNFEQINAGNYERPKLYALSKTGQPDSWTQQFLLEDEAQWHRENGYIVKPTTPHDSETKCRYFFEI